MQDETVFKNFMTMLGEVFEKDITKSLSDIYWMALNEYNDTECEMAFKSAIVRCRFFPKPAELIEFIESSRPPAPQIEAVAEQQWRIVLTTLGRGPFDDPITRRLCKRQFNHAYLRNMLEREENWEQKRFCNAYELAASMPEDYVKIEDNRVKELAENVLKPIKFVDMREKRIAYLRRQADEIKVTG